MDLLRRPSALPVCRLRAFAATTLLLVVLVILGGMELGVVPGSPVLDPPAKPDTVVETKDRDPLCPALSPSLLSSKGS